VRLWLTFLDDRRRVSWGDGFAPTRSVAVTLLRRRRFPRKIGRVAVVDFEIEDVIAVT